MRMLEMLMPLTQIDQGVVDYLDTDGMVKHLIKVLGVPATTVRGEQEVYQKRVERQQQQAQAQEMAQTTQVAEAAGAAAPMVKALNVGNIIEAGAVPQQAAE
jgi:CO dehydrogenase nickel-insertion accessory protein CooC1